MFSSPERSWEGRVGGKFWEDLGKVGILEELGLNPWEGVLGFELQTLDLELGLLIGGRGPTEGEKLGRQLEGRVWWDRGMVQTPGLAPPLALWAAQESRLGWMVCTEDCPKGLAGGENQHWPLASRKMGDSCCSGSSPKISTWPSASVSKGSALVSGLSQPVMAQSRQMASRIPAAMQRAVPAKRQMLRARL